MSAARVPVSGLHLEDGPYALRVVDLPPERGQPEMRVVRVPVNTDGHFVIFGTAEQIAGFAAELAQAIADHDAEVESAAEGDLAEALGEALDEVTARAGEPVDAEVDG
jgi:hypothetical protein